MYLDTHSLFPVLPLTTQHELHRREEVRLTRDSQVGLPCWNRLWAKDGFYFLS